MNMDSMVQASFHVNSALCGFSMYVQFLVHMENPQITLFIQSGNSAYWEHHVPVWGLPAHMVKGLNYLEILLPFHCRWCKILTVSKDVMYDGKEGH